MSFGAIATVVSIGTTIYGIGQQRAAIRQETETAEANMEFNAAQTRREAERTRLVGAEDEFQLRTDLRRRLSANRVRTAAAGVETAGTPLETELMLIRDFAGDIATIEEQTRLESQELELLADFQDENATDVGKAGKIRQQTATVSGIGQTATILANSDLFA